MGAGVDLFAFATQPLTLIATVTLVSHGVSLFSTNERSVVTAEDLLKTCVGFFIGIATSYFGPT